jgi:hypothetical protein
VSVFSARALTTIGVPNVFLHPVSHWAAIPNSTMGSCCCHPDSVALLLQI